MKKTFYIYPIIFQWENIIPTDYPFIKIGGPGKSVGCMLAFANHEEYKEYCNDKYYRPIIVEMEEEDRWQYLKQRQVEKR